jgi:transcriptional regulator with XRE-family HTH domain
MKKSSTKNNTKTNSKKKEISTDTVGGRIKSLRMNGKFTQQSLAIKLNTDKAVVCRWENGDREPSLSAIKDMAEIFHVSPAYIAFGPEEGPDVLDLSQVTLYQANLIKQLVKEFASR